MIRMLLVNTGSNVLLMLVKLAITFIMTPIFLRNLGNYDYGLWEMIGGVIGYMGMLDIGIRPAISRYAAKYRAEGDRDNLNIVFTSTFAFMALIGILLLAVFSTWGFVFPDTLAEEGTSTQRYTLFLLIIGGQLLIMFPGYVAESYLEGFQKFYLKNNIAIFNSVVGAIILYQYMTPENALILLAAANAIGLVIKYLIYFVLLARPVMAGIVPELQYFSLGKLKEILLFGSKSFIQGAAGKIGSTSDRIIIGLIMGPAVVPFYTIPAALLGNLSGVTMTVTHAFMPLFSDLNARHEQQKIRRIYLFASKLVVAFLFPMGVGAVIIGGPFIEIWLQGEFRREQIDAIVLLLTIVVVVPKLNPFVSRYLTAIGRHGIFAKIAPVAALVNLGISIPLVYKFGIIGAAMGSVLPAIVVTPLYLRYACRYLKFSAMEYIQQSILPVLVPSLIMGVIAAWIRFDWGLDSFTEIFGCVAIGAIVYFICFWLLSIKPQERTFLLGWVRNRGRVHG